MNKREQVVAQCTAVAYLAESLARVHRDYARFIYHDLIDQVGKRTAAFMETLGDMLNGMDALDPKEDGFLDPIFEEAHRLWPQPKIRSLLEEAETMKAALLAAKLDIEERSDPCGEPYNTICRALALAEDS